jgi:hypothetical protein
MFSKLLVRRLSACLLLGSPTLATPAPRPRPLASFQAATLERAREGAARKLARPECQRVLDDFQDAAGRPLSAKLEAFDRSAPDYLRMIPFLDGSSERLCRSGRAEMFTVMGIPRVFVCPSFVEKQIRDPLTAESIVIHEMLHTLGLGENPPSSREITSRVNHRCQ